MLCLSGFELYSRWVPLLKHVARGHFHGNRMKFRGSRHVELRV